MHIDYYYWKCGDVARPFEDFARSEYSDTVTDLEMPDTRHSVLSFKWHGLKRRAVVRRDIKIDSLTLDLGPLEMWDQP